MPRPKIVLNRNDFTTLLTSMDQSGQFATTKLLIEGFVKAWNEKYTPISSSVVKLRITEFGIKLQTVPGKKGRQASVSSDKEAVKFTGIYDGPGKRRKQCSACSTWIGYSYDVCPKCQAQLSSKDMPTSKTTQEVKVEIEQKQQEMLVGSSSLQRIATKVSKGILIVAVPAGRCTIIPSNIDNPDRKSVIEWANRVVDSRIPHNELYLASALQYCARTFWDCHHQNFEQICSWLQEEFDPKQNSGWEETHSEQENEKSNVV